MNINNFSAAQGDSKGEINLQWDSVSEAESYVIEIACQSEKIKWNIVDIIPDPRYTVKNLKSNKIYIFRVASISANGEGILCKKFSRKIIRKAP
ncbi:MAG: fibronectin type III domain-containing protein [Ignavibacteria bacterium]|nr:fibronectin type III domain-containing protein [Ignavibacteria bacterium]